MKGRPLHILYAVPGYKPAYRIGGPIVTVVATAEGLVRKGHRVTVFTSDSNFDQTLDVPVDRPIDVDGVEVWYFRRQKLIPPSSRLLPSYFSKSLGFLYAPQMASALARLVPSVDVVHTHLPFIYPTLAASRAAFRLRKPLVYHQHGVLNPDHLRFRSLKKKIYIHTVEKPIMTRATTLIALTEAEKESYRALGVATPCEVIPNGINVSEYRTTPKMTDEELGIPRGARVVLFLGRLHPFKGIDRLLAAFLRVARQFPDAVLVMAGPDEWSVSEKLSAVAQEAGIRDRLILTGMVTGARKLDLLARADLFCLPSDGEGFSIAVLEAMASGTAVMLSPGCHFPEAARHGAGVVVGTGVDELTAEMSTMLRDRGQLAAMGERGRALVRDQYRWELITDRLIEVYDAGIERFARA